MSAQATPEFEPSRRSLPDYLAARKINEYAYCPRLFYFEQVEGVFVHNEHTAEGSAQHKSVDKEGGSAPAPGDVSAEPAVVRSITLSSEEHRVIAKLDLAEFADGHATPVDYKHGRPMSRTEGVEAWPSDRVQLAVQALVLRANGYGCDEGIVFYQKTRQRVRVVFDSETIAEAERTVAGAWRTAAAPIIPPPLVDSPKCPGCSLVGICMPDETRRLQDGPADSAGEQLGLFDSARKIPKKSPARETRLLVAPRVDRRPLYLNSQGLRVGKSGGVLRIKERDKVVQEARINEICQVNLMGNIQISTQAVQELCQAEKPICYFSQGGWFYGVTTGLNTKNVMLRRAQFRLAEENWFRRRIARKLVAGKIRNQRTLLLRNHIEPPKAELREMKRLVGRAEIADSLEELLGVEGLAARIYFSLFAGMLKRGDHWDRDPTGVLRLSSAQPPAAARSGQRAPLARLQPSCERPHGSLLRRRIRPDDRLLSSAAPRATGAGTRFDGSVASACRRLRCPQRRQYQDDFRARLRDGRTSRFANCVRSQEFLSSL